MNLAIHDITEDLSKRWADTFYEDKHPDVKGHFILANPPFNMSDWARRTDDPRWRDGTPPAGNANFAWLQHIVSKLGSRGAAGVVLANGSMSSRQSGEGEIRAALVEADLVACMIALPPQLFRTTQIPACLWFFNKDKTPQGAKRLVDRRGEMLFIDARNMGTMLDRTERILTPEDIAKIAGAYHAWLGTPSSRDAGLTYKDVPGFCYSATTEEIRKHEQARSLRRLRRFFMLRGLGLRTMNSDSAVPGLNRSNALALPARLPDEDDIRIFHEEVRPLFTLRQALSADSVTLTELRDTLLPKLMSGEVRVRDAEKVVEEVT